MSTDEIMKLADLYYNNPYREYSYTHLVYADQRRAALRKAVEELVTDAARYRAIRDGLEVDPENSGIVVSLIDDFGGSTLRGDDADSAIDAAMKKETS